MNCFFFIYSSNFITNTHQKDHLNFLKYITHSLLSLYSHFNSIIEIIILNKQLFSLFIVAHSFRIYIWVDLYCRICLLFMMVMQLAYLLNIDSSNFYVYKPTPIFTNQSLFLQTKPGFSQTIFYVYKPQLHFPNNIEFYKQHFVL